MDERHIQRQELYEGIGVVLAILFAIFLLAYAVFDTWADWGPNGPVNEWTNIPMVLLGVSGLTQLVYTIPCYLFFNRKNKPYIARGVLWGTLLVMAGNLFVYIFWIK